MRQTIASVERKFFTDDVSWEQISGQKTTAGALHISTKVVGVGWQGHLVDLMIIDPTMVIRGNGAGSINLSGQISGHAGDFRSISRVFN